MIYGRLLNSIKAQEVTNESNEFDITSVVYAEYLNRKAMLEACTVEADKAVLEAQVKVLYEVSIKDIFEAIKKAIKWIIDRIVDLLNRIKDFFSRIIDKSRGSWNDIKNKLSKLNINESAISISESEESNTDLKTRIVNKLIDRINTMKESDELYFLIEEYYFIDDKEYSKLKEAMNDFINKLKSDVNEDELKEVVENFKKRYAVDDNKADLYTKSVKIKDDMKHFPVEVGSELLQLSDENLVKYHIYKEKENFKLKSASEVIRRCEEIEKMDNNISEIRGFIVKLNKYSKELENACDTCENIIQKNTGRDNYTGISSLITDLNSMFRINIKCYSSAIKYLNIILNKAEQSRMFVLNNKDWLLDYLDRIV